MSVPAISVPVACTTAVTVVTVDPRDDERWQHLVDRFPSDVFHAPAWMRVLRDTYGFDLRAHLVLDHEGLPIGGLPFCHVHDMLGDRLVTLPFSDYCDPLVNDTRVWTILTADHLTRDW